VVFRTLFALHVLGGALVVGWAVCEAVLRLVLRRQRLPAARLPLMILSLALQPVAHLGFTLALVAGFVLQIWNGGFAAAPGYIQVKVVVAAGIVLVFAAGARSTRQARAALRAARAQGASNAELDLAFARNGTWERLAGLGFLLDFLLGLFRPGT
jgi:hypothetical protein